MQKMLVRVAVVQAGSILFDRDRTIEKASTLPAMPPHEVAELVVFPEAFIGGYPRRSLHFGARGDREAPRAGSSSGNTSTVRSRFRVHLAALSQLSHGVMGFTWSSV